ncbi:unnamed protein product [Rhizoctonia solani]|uniref:F-box domain-containing protein n=1 Tax=Rhizoctonia solani TaxID=456999 RepID=A0A8H3HCF6_9AGAM|nr:unnamed protein product [Rhizoctonia solani]
MLLNSLPLEVLRTILCLLPRDAIAPASLVCKTWRSLVLPRLYRSILFHGDPTKSQWRNEFLKKIVDEPEGYDEGHASLVVGYVKRLHVESNMDKEELEDFGLAVVKMKNLEHLDWTVSVLEGIGWYATLVQLYQELPKLRSLSLTMGKKDIPLYDLDEVVAFTDLRELSITLFLTEVPDEELPETLIELIRGARNIESLRLVFEEDYESELAYDQWGSVDVFSKLVSDHFPNLRILETHSQYLAPIDNFNAEFRRFIQNHNQLQKIIIFTDGCGNGLELANPPSLIVTPVDMEEMMPSVRHFAGPGLLVGALLKSKLAKQIQFLELHEPGASELGGLSDLFSELDSPTSPELSSLKGLGLFMSSGGEETEWGIILDTLPKLAIRMPVLQELILCPTEKPAPDELDQLLSILEHLPHLHRLVFPVSEDFVDGSKDDVIQCFYERAKALCPLLDLGDSSNPVFSSIGL